VRVEVGLAGMQRYLSRVVVCKEVEPTNSRVLSVLRAVSAALCPLQGASANPGL
jgi:hypothetical protein